MASLIKILQLETFYVYHKFVYETENPHINTENSHIRRTLSYCQFNDDWKFTLLQNYTNRKAFRKETVTTAINVNLLDKLNVLRFCLFVNILTSLWFDVEPHITIFERM